MEINIGDNFKNDRIQLDDKKFERCTFRNCVVVYAGGPLIFSSNKLDGVTWEFEGPAGRTISLMSSFYQSGGGAKHLVEKILLEGSAGFVETGKPLDPVEDNAKDKQS